MKKFGFTLVEVIAIIAIIGVIAVLVIPQVKTSLYAKKQKQYDNIISTIKSAAKVYYNNDKSENTILVDSLISNNYLHEIINPLDNTKISGCVRIVKNNLNAEQYEYISDINECSFDFTYSQLIVDLDGGSTTQTFENEYITGAHFVLEVPIKNGFVFAGWSVEGENAGITDEGELVIGDNTTTITANWASMIYTIKYNCDENSGSTPDSIHEYDVSKPLSVSNCFKVTGGNSGMVYYVSQWKTSLLPDAITYDAEEVVLNLTATSNGIINLYPVWANLFSYDKSYSVEDDGDGKWRIKLKASGEFKSFYDMDVDIFLVGGGGGGGRSSFTSGDQAGGGGGYAVTETNIPLIGGNDYTTIVGAGGQYNQAGKTTSIVVDGTTYSAPGGQKGGQNSYSDGGSCGFKVYGGAGGSGGGGCGGVKPYRGGSDGADGVGYGGKGQDNTAGYVPTTREFGEASGDLYSGGGAGVSCNDCSGVAGGDGGGGKSCSNGTANTGGGGGGRYNGGSGIIVIRKHKT